MGATVCEMTAEVTDEQTATSGAALWWTQRPLWYLAVVAIGVAGLLFGVGLRPDFDSQIWRMDDPFNVDVRTTDTSSPLGWIIADLLGIDSEPAYLVFHLTILVAALIASSYLIAGWVSDWAARLFVAAWFASPIANVNVSWLGKPDHFTLLATVLIGFGPSSACVAGGMLLGFNHAEQGAIIIAGSYVVRRFTRNETGTLVPMVAGWVVGRALWQVYAWVAGIDSGSGRADYILESGIGKFTDVWAGEIPTLLFGAFAILWLPVIIVWRQLDRSAQTATVVIVLTATVAAALTVDTTRVYGLLTFPLVLGVVGLWAERDRAETVRWFGWFLLAALIVPRVQLWSLDPYVSSWDRLL